MGVSIRYRLPAAAFGAVLAGVATVAPAPAAAARTAQTWQVAALPPLAPASRLVDVSATGRDDAWAVGLQGSTYGGPAPARPYALMHWDGGTWSQRSLPENIGTLYGVSARSATDAWTVGADGTQAAYAAHWNGTAWQGYRPLGGVPGGASVLFDVAATGGRPVFAGAESSHALVVEWDGQQFTRVPLPGSDAWYGVFYGAATAPDGAAFAVGAWSVDDAPYPEPMIAQRIGTTWRLATLPKITSARLLGVWAGSAGNAWAVGTIDYDSAPKPLILHWDGSSWRQVASPTPAGSLTAVAGDAAGNLWVSGNNPIPPWILYPGSLFLRYQAGQWSTVYGPKANNEDPALSAVANVPGTSGFWSVGAVYDPVGGYTAIIERIRG
ncbi:hypothetical protein Daura_28410 [Dactylosporangium aurantiacum]|uniref:Secreted protein n=1 Tax=Dactylosporangium aurantiacum TaxID=35754 RepID=A0A9Q9I992_9ACTN|nr:hypothetical protein [Dactylosporangium aurantiacum]MDG6110466.1 hypothetical protein [Dactylosporangium aurantiacum]UWZ50736.1 hypothetical protein Daura_28410 [Dactylosporangium aurantiacum]